MESDFKKKLNYSNKLLDNILSKHKSIIVACSFGKDSMVALHMIKTKTNNFKVIWNNTLVEYPDTYKFAKFIIKSWNLDCIEAKPKTTFWEIVKKYGFPINSRNCPGPNQVATYKCCDELKKKPTKIILKNLIFDLYVTGLTRHESRLRELSARKYGPYFFSTKWNHWKCHPILDWTAEDVWQYHSVFNLPYNPLYDKNDVYIQGGIRTGCWPCPQAIKYGKLEHLRTYYPKLFHFLIKDKGLGEVIIEKRINKLKNNAKLESDYLRAIYFKALGINTILDIKPCYFDRL